MNKKIDRVLDFFTQINNIPRQSKNETAISNWLVDWAVSSGFEVERDDFLDVLIKVPGSKGYEDRETIVFQGHMDMVCEKTPESDHDFSKDPIQMYKEDGWLKAKGTSLGADNGIALALALALSTDSDVKHPPMELLFTVDEETGLTGAVNLPSNWLTGKKLINIDSEDEGVFTIGCAGGRDANISLNAEQLIDQEFDTSIELSVSGLKGGHSGVDIHLEKGNANIILARLITLIKKADIDLGLVDIEGGSAHNAIPRDCRAKLNIDSRNLNKAEEIISSFLLAVKDEYKTIEPDLFITCQEGEVYDKCYNLNVIDLLLALPHGVMYNSQQMKGIVETSSNVAVIKKDDSVFKILMSQRSSNMSRLDEISNKIDNIVNLTSATVEFGGGYPSWEPDFESDILREFKSHYKKLFKKDVLIEVIHAGLECGVIGSKYPGMQMISIGPTIKSPHCPDEKMLISTIGDIWELLVEYLKHA